MKFWCNGIKFSQLGIKISCHKLENFAVDDHFSTLSCCWDFVRLSFYCWGTVGLLLCMLLRTSLGCKCDISQKVSLVTQCWQKFWRYIFCWSGFFDLCFLLVMKWLLRGFCLLTEVGNISVVVEVWEKFSVWWSVAIKLWFYLVRFTAEYTVFR